MKLYRYWMDILRYCNTIFNVMYHYKVLIKLRQKDMKQRE